jgi:hypothetical protein
VSTVAANSESDGQAPDVEVVLQQVADLEAAVGVEVQRLSKVRAPRNGPRMPQHLNQPLWWWRYKLICWAHARKTVNAHDGDLLRGLRAVLKDWDDGSLLEFFRGLPAVPRISGVRRRTA